MKTKTAGEKVGKWESGKLLILALLTFSLSHFPAVAADYYTTVTITVTNTSGIATNGTDTLIVIGDTRTATNNVAGNPSKFWLGTNAHLRSATNLYTHLALYPFGSGATRLGAPRWGATNIIRLDSQINQSISASVGGVWGTVLVTTNYTTNTIPVTVPATTWTDAQKTNIGNGLVAFLDRASSSIAATAQGLSNYVAIYTQQTLSNKVFFASTNRGGALENIEKMSGTNATWTNVVLVVVDLSRVQSLSGYATAITNGSFWSNILFHARLSDPFTTNLVNYGNAIRSEGSGGNSFQIGSNAQATGSLSFAGGNGALAVSANALANGNSALASNINTTALGVGAQAISQYATAAGAGAQANGANSFAGGEGVIVDGPSAIGIGDSDTQSILFGDIAIGSAAVAQGGKSAAFGVQASAGHTNSTAVGRSATTTTTNQIRLGTATETVSAPGNLEVTGKTQLGTATNNTLTGTNVLNGRLDLTPRANTAFANGYNSGSVLGTNVYIRCSGPTAAYTNAGFAAAVDGTWHKVQFDNPGLSYTLLPESGLEATAANRILTGTGALLNSTNNPAVAEMMYDGTVSRWRVWTFR